jgi:hypothetical protein
MAKKIAAMAVLFAMVSLNAWAVDPIVTDSTSNSTSTSKSDSTTRVISPPPTAVAPAVTVINNDVCATAASGAVQTQILGISMGGTVRDMNCERIKLSKNLYDMGMKVAAVATLCQDDRVFQAMLDAGTPCPVMGKIGESAKEVWIQRGRVNEKDIVKQTPEKAKEEPLRETGKKDDKEVQETSSKSNAETFPVARQSTVVANPLCATDPKVATGDPVRKAELNCK